MKKYKVIVDGQEYEVGIEALDTAPLSATQKPAARLLPRLQLAVRPSTAPCPAPSWRSTCRRHRGQEGPGADDSGSHENGKRD